MKLRSVYDPAYIEARDRLIPKAEAYAKAVAIPCHRGIDTQWDGGFSKAFCDRMQRLAEDAGLTASMRERVLG